jgi:hypothetical protein
VARKQKGRPVRNKQRNKENVVQYQGTLDINFTGAAEDVNN